MLRTPKKIQSDINRLKAQKKVVPASKLFTTEEQIDLIEVYDDRLRKLEFELKESEETCVFIDKLMVVDPVILSGNEQMHH